MARRLGLSQDGAITMAHRYFPSVMRQREEVQTLDTWHRGEQENTLFIPQESTDEYKGLAQVSTNSWASLIVTAVVQNAELTGMRMPGKDTNLSGWRSWQQNRMDGKQPRLYRASCAHGLAFVWAERSTSRMTGEPMSRFHVESAKDMAAFYTADDDEWPRFALLVEEVVDGTGSPAGWTVWLFDEVNIYVLHAKGDGFDVKDWSYISEYGHGATVCPVVMYAPNVDIDGRANSDLQGLLPLLARIDQDTFDRLIVQRFGAWKVRWIAGMTKPTNDADAEAQKLRLRVETLLIAQDHETKFGTLDASDLAGFIASRDSDLRDLSALSQTPPHHMLGLASNLQAESLAAAEAGLQRKSREHRMSWGESHEQLFRLDAHLRGDINEATAYEMQAKWRDTESRSLEQAAMALGMLATNLKVPVEMLWERIPGWTDLDVNRAKELIEDGGVDTLLAELEELAKREKAAGGPAE